MTTLDPNIIAAILGWMPVVGFTELLKQSLKWDGVKAALLAIAVAAFCTAIYLWATDAFAPKTFVLVWFAVTGEATGIFRAFKK